MSLTHSKTFIQYKYCSLCRVSCKKFKKHVHSQSHQKVVQNILNKFTRKISDAKAHLDEHVIKDVNWREADKQFWCYFCQLDVGQHLRKTTMMGECIVLDGGFLGHLTREDHVEQSARFLKENVVNMTRTPEFILKSESFLKFMEKVEKACTDFFKQRDLALKKVAVSIEAQNALRRHVVRQGLLEQVCGEARVWPLHRLSQKNNDHGIQVSVSSRENSVVTAKDGGESAGKKTVRAFGVGLTVVERLNEDDTKGNIHSDALPPWLQADTEEEKDKNVKIGPSMTDLEKFKKLVKKSKLPACRVGVNFDRAASQSGDWLPNFGGVWSRGPRTKSGQQFHRRQNHQIASDGNVKSTEKGQVNSVRSHVEGEHFVTASVLSSHFKEPGDAAQCHNFNNQSTPTNDLNQAAFHLQPSTSQIFGAECLYPEISDQDSDPLLSQGIRPYVSKRKRKFENAEPMSNNNHGIDRLQYLQSGFSSNFPSSPTNMSIQATAGVLFMKDRIYPNSMESRQPFETQVPSYPSIRLLSTPVLNMKKRK